MTRKMMVMTGLGALILITAGASAYVTSRLDERNTKVVAETKKPRATQKEQIAWNDPKPAPQPQAPSCNDGNIVGLVLGGAAGGLAGNQIGSGSGNTVATIGGAVGGAYLGKEYIPTQNVTCR